MCVCMDGCITRAGREKGREKRGKEKGERVR